MQIYRVSNQCAQIPCHMWIGLYLCVEFLDSFLCPYISNQNVCIYTCGNVHVGKYVFLKTYSSSSASHTVVCSLVVFVCGQENASVTTIIY